MKKHWLILILLTFLSVGFISANAKASLTIATFDDPADNNTTPLFTVDFRPAQMKLNGGWSNDQNGLTLEIPYSGYTVANSNAFQDAWFEMDEVEITSTYVILGVMCGDTGDGEINFYEKGTTTNPLLTISFESGLVSRFNFGSGDTNDVGTFVAERVTISGIGITPGSLTDEWFSFAFDKKVLLPGSSTFDDGFTATAAFTSSAVPEPATVCILGLGALSLVRKKHA